MLPNVTLSSSTPLVYPESDGLPMAENTKQFRWIVVIATNLAALFVILFIYGWNQYLWPLLVTTSRDYETMVVGVSKMIGTGDAQNEWNTIMATAVLTMLPPVGIIVLMQRWFVKGLVESEK